MRWPPTASCPTWAFAPRGERVWETVATTELLGGALLPQGEAWGEASTRQRSQLRGRASQGDSSEGTKDKKPGFLGALSPLGSIPSGMPHGEHWAVPQTGRALQLLPH